MGLFLSMGERAYTLSSYFVSPLFCIYFFVVSGFPCLLFLVPVGFEHTQLSTRHWAFCCASWAFAASVVGIAFSSQNNLTLFRYSSHHIGNRFTFLACPCRMIWFEEYLKGSYKVVLCPRSGEGYFGLARRTYSLQCPPDIAAVRLNRFTFRQCDEAIPTRGSWALRCRSRERSMALPQLPAHALNKLEQRGIILNDLKVPKVLTIPKKPSIRVAFFMSSSYFCFNSIP